MLTGESLPVSKSSETNVIGGSINGEGSLTVEIKKTGADSFIAQVIELVNQAQQSKSKTQDLANRAAFWLTVVAIMAGVITLIAWLAFMNAGLAFALERTVTVMVITCPHALGLAIPLVVAVSTALAARKGLLIRNRRAFETARNIQAVIFDKTGTLTQGMFAVTEVFTLDAAMSEKDLLKYAASVESHSEHPIARGIAKSVPDIFPVERFRSIPGTGAEGIVNGKNVRIVSPGFLAGTNAHIMDERIEKIRLQGKTIVYVLIDDSIRGVVALADVIRPESKEAIRRLKAMGVQCMMLTGDNAQVAAWVAGEVGLDEYFAEVLPQNKADKVREVQSRGLVVAMAGDG